MGQDYSSNPESLGSTRDSQVWPWEEGSEKSGWYSVSMPRETERTRQKSFRKSNTNSDAMKASRKCLSTLRRCTFRYGRDSWLHRCRQHCTWTRVTKKKRIWNYSRILNLRKSKALSGITRMMIEGNSEIKNVFPADVASSLW